MAPPATMASVPATTRGVMTSASYSSNISGSKKVQTKTALSIEPLALNA